MNKYRVWLLSLLFAAFCPNIVTNANAQTQINIAAEAEVAARQKILFAADALIKDGKPAEAYALLEPYQSEQAGNPDYDYLLGIAALDSGKPSEAVFALERVLAVNSRHLQARAEIARAYLASGEVAAARQELETVRQQNPPSEVSATIQKYLDIIETSRTDRTTTVQGYVETTVGDDSNINSATASNQVAIPVFGGAISTLSTDGVKTHDTFGSVATGFNVRHAITPEWAVIGGANFNQRMNSSKNAFNIRNLDGTLGVNRTKGDNNYSVVLQLQGFDVDNKRHRDASGMTAQWQSKLNNSSQASIYLQYTYLSYPDQSVRNADRYVVGAAYAHSLPGQLAPVIYVSGYGGTEKERQANLPHLGHHVYGLRLGGEMKLTAQTKLFVSASAEGRNYGGQDPFFQTDRKDMQTDLRLGISYAPARQWTVSTNLNYTHNDSNIIISKYERTMFTIGVRRDFN